MGCRLMSASIARGALDGIQLVMTSVHKILNMMTKISGATVML